MFNKKELVFATNNAHKLQEVREMLGDDYEIKGLKDIGCDEDIAETGETFQENASLKSQYVFKRFAISCFSDDSGLEVDALNGVPGVYSARYAGEHGNSEANMDKLLQALAGNTHRQAQFRSVISLLLNGKEYFFEGIVRGTIRYERSGVKGFGYDPIFQPDGHSQTFAEMLPEQKNALSHRGHAIRQLVDFLKG